MRGTTIVILAVAVPLLALLLSLGPAAAPAHNSLTLELVSQTRGSTCAVHVVCSYAYIGEGPRLVILDISDPSNPTELGRTDVLPGVVRSVHLVGDYAYIADEDEGGLRVISVSDKANPTEVGFFDTPGFACGVHVVGDYAYVPMGVRAFVSSPLQSRPTLSRSASSTQQAMHMAFMS